MKAIYFLFICALTAQSVYGQNYTVGVQSLTWTDSSRSNRSVPVEFHYPGNNTSIANDSFGFVVFGHGFDIPISAYYNYADSLATHGYIVALTSNEGGLSPSHPELAQDLLYIYNMMISQGKNNTTSLLYHHVKSRGAIAGHSMGGGCAVLSCQYSDTATCYWTLSEATTTPSSITAAAYMFKPYLSFAGSDDCIAPPSTNQIPTYDSARSICKTFVEITNATHCQFASSNSTCVLGEVLTGCSSTPLSEVAQTDSALSYIYPYLDYYLNGNCNAWTAFENIYNSDINDVKIQSCNNVIPVSQAITGAPSFCSGDSDVLTATPAGFNYQWSNNSTGSFTHVSSPGIYSVTISNGVCSVTVVPFAVVEQFPPSALQSIVASDTVCSGIANISIAVPHDSSATSYNWTLPTGWSISGNSDTNAITAISGNGSGIISVTAQNNCGTSAPVQRSIVVLPSNLGTPGSISGDTSLCVGQSASYAIASVSGANSYLWSYPSNWTPSSGNGADSVSLIVGNLSGNITVQAVNGCGQGIPSSLTVNTLSVPVAGNISGTDSICLNADSLQLFGLSGLSGADSIYWSVPNGWIIVSGQGTAHISVNNYHSGGAINVAAYNVCGVTNATPINLTVIDTPTALMSKSGDTLIASAGFSYQWYLNGNEINGAVNQSYVASATGNYTVAVTNAANCTGVSSSFSFVYLDVKAITDNNSITIFPNPSVGGKIQLMISNEMLGNELIVFDALGRKVFQTRLMALNSFIDMSSLSKGVYLACIRLNGNDINKKLIVE